MYELWKHEHIQHFTNTNYEGKVPWEVESGGGGFNTVAGLISRSAPERHTLDLTGSRRATNNEAQHTKRIANLDNRPRLQ
jgi:hypothetical protein